MPTQLDYSARRFIRDGLAPVVILSLVLTPLAGEAQPAGKVCRIGFTGSLPNHPLADLLIEVLRDRGWTEGRDFVLERHSSGQNRDGAVVAAKELVEQRVDLIVSANTTHAFTGKQVACRPDQRVHGGAVGG